MISLRFEDLPWSGDKPMATTPIDPYVVYFHRGCFACPTTIAVVYVPHRRGVLPRLHVVTPDDFFDGLKLWWPSWGHWEVRTEVAEAIAGEILMWGVEESRWSQCVACEPDGELGPGCCDCGDRDSCVAVARHRYRWFREARPCGVDEWRVWPVPDGPPGHWIVPYAAYLRGRGREVGPRE